LSDDWPRRFAAALLERAKLLAAEERAVLNRAGEHRDALVGADGSERGECFEHDVVIRAERPTLGDDARQYWYHAGIAIPNERVHDKASQFTCGCPEHQMNRACRRRVVDVDEGGNRRASHP
jgi:hypothetical protein